MAEDGGKGKNRKVETFKSGSRKAKSGKWKVDL
jgi:hypothetical protein